MHVCKDQPITVTDFFDTGKMCDVIDNDCSQVKDCFNGGLTDVMKKN